MAGFISIPLKKTSEVDLIKPLKNLIASTYSSSDNPENYGDALAELNKLRMNATWRTLDKHESSLEVMYRYYDQLVALEGKIPSSDIQIFFKWKDAFDKGSIFGGKIGLTLASIPYEKACILFNIAAMQSQIAASQNSENDDGLKLMTKFFQQSCGIFAHLKNTIMSAIQQDPTPDLLPDTLSALSALMLAQAQESFFLKAANDNMKDAIIAKVSSQCEDLYSDALKQMQKESLRPLWEKDWVSIAAAKQAAYHALSEYYQARVAKANKNIGEELARLQHALELIKAAENRSGIIGAYKDWAGRIQRAYEETKKDNDFIYHERIPDVKTLSPVGKAAIAKVAPLPDKLSMNFKDLFDSLMPISVQQSVAAFDVRKSEIVNKEIATLRENTQLLNGVLVSLNLPAALEDISGETLPQSLKDKANTIREKDGIIAIEKLIQDLPELLQRNKEILDEAERMLNDEQDSDNQLRSQFKEKWTRIASEKLTEPMRVNASKYRTIINNAMQADSIVREKFNAHKNGIMLLSKPEGELEAAIPATNPTKVLQGSNSVQQLRNLMREVDAIKSERDAIESELKNSTFDMKAQFLSALARDGVINEPVMSVETLGHVFGPLQQRIAASVENQKRLIEEIQAANTEFCQQKSSSQTSNQREVVLQDLAAAYNAYMELTSNLQEGTKFYNDLTQLLVNFQNKVNDFCFARKTEKEELMRDLQQSIANSSGAAPSPPPHATNTTPDAKKQPPARPPPPAPPVPSHGTNFPTSSAPTAQLPSSAPAAAAPTYPTGGQPSGGLPYPMQPQGMPMPQPYAPYPFNPPTPYAAPYATPMPTGYNPYPTYPLPTGYIYQQQQQPPPPSGQYPNYPGNQQPTTYPQQRW